MWQNVARCGKVWQNVASLGSVDVGQQAMQQAGQQATAGDARGADEGGLEEELTRQWLKLQLVRRVAWPSALALECRHRSAGYRGVSPANRGLTFPSNVALMHVHVVARG